MQQLRQQLLQRLSLSGLPEVVVRAHHLDICHSVMHRHVAGLHTT